MRSLYLILAATAVAVTAEPQHTNNDIIWYPVDDEDGVFVSTIGEKHRTPHASKWRSHRRARYTGGPPLPLPLSFDPTDNHDPSFFHDIRQRLPYEGRPNLPDSTFQEILNEVFDYKHSPVTEPANSWSESQLQWEGTRPEGDLQWVSSSKLPSTTKRLNQEGDRLVFPGETSRPTSTSSDVLPTEPPTLSPCERKCPVTPEFNPVCGSDGVTYSNGGRLKCAHLCGKDVRLSHHGNCGRTPLVTPLLSNNRKQKYAKLL